MGGGAVGEVRVHARLVSGGANESGRKARPRAGGARHRPTVMVAYPWVTAPEALGRPPGPAAPAIALSATYSLSRSLPAIVAAVAVVVGVPAPASAIAVEVNGERARSLRSPHVRPARSDRAKRRCTCSRSFAFPFRDVRRDWQERTSTGTSRARPPAGGASHSAHASFHPVTAVLSSAPCTLALDLGSFLGPNFQVQLQSPGRPRLLWSVL